MRLFYGCLMASRPAFDDFDAFRAHWRDARSAHAVDGALIDEAVALTERLIAETDATGQGRERHLVRALDNFAEASEFSNATSADPTDLAEAADALVVALNSVVNG